MSEMSFEIRAVDRDFCGDWVGQGANFPDTEHWSPFHLSYSLDFATQKRMRGPFGRHGTLD